MKKLVLILSILLFSTSSSFSTTLPSKVVNYIREQVPNASVRFDGLVMFPDKTTYLPLIPAMEASVTQLETVYTYPAKSDLKKKAEIIVFNNNYVLLKVIKDKNGVTISKDTNYPIAVKSGVLPQDMLVPKGLYIPESLEGILGDLKVPVGNPNNAVVKKNETELNDETVEFLDKKIPITIPKISALKNKLYFITNYDSDYIRVVNSDNTQPLYSLKLDSIPSSVTPAGNNKYLLITTGGKTYLDVVDVQRGEVAKQLDLTTEPSDVVADDANNLAYVAAKDDEAIFIVDTKTMELKHKVLIKGCPSHLAISDDGEKLLYQDKNSAMLYVIYPKKDYRILSMFVMPNISKLVATNNAVYAISRTKNQLEVMAYPSEEMNLPFIGNAKYKRTLLDAPAKPLPVPVENIIMAQKQISEKPVDMIYYKDKLYILGAKQNQLNIYDTLTNEVIKTIDLPVGGFSKKITRVDKTNYVVISNAREEKYLIFDLDTNSTVQQVPINTRINNLVIIEKLPSSSKTAKDAL